MHMNAYPLCLVGLLLSLGTGAASAQSSFSSSAVPRTLLLRGSTLAASRARSGDADLKPAVSKLRRDAEKALSAPLLAVTDKSTLLPPSGNAHDYYSLSPYWWPDPAKADGLPYIRKDGETNPESKRDLDQPRIAAMSDRVETLVLGWWFTGDRRFAEQAARQLRTWFLDSTTRMTPHLRYAQLVRGNEKERGSGIIDSRGLTDVVDAIVLLGQSTVWSEADDRAIRQWFGEYARWLRESPNGKTEQRAANNHGSWYAAQVATFALFAGDTVEARATVAGIRDRIAAQIDSGGRQPEELTRTRSFHYSNFNLIALTRLAELGRLLDIDLWKYRAPSGGSLAAAIDRLAPFVDRQKEWPDPERDEVDADVLLDTFRKARAALGDAKYDAVIARMPADKIRSDRSVLIYAGARPSR